MTMILPLVSLAIGFLALFAAIWILHKPLDVHKCPSRPVRNVHRALEWILTILGVALLVQIGCLVAAPRRCAAADPIARNKDAMRRFETCINENDLALGRKLISEKAAFATPVSPEPLHGAEGYLSVVSLMRASFPDVHWKLEEMVADERTVAVRWTCTGTFTGAAPFAGIEPNGRSFSTSVMNFYSFDADGKIVNDVAATGIAGILQGIGAAPADQ